MTQRETDEITDWTASEIASRVARREVSAREVTAAFLARIAAIEPTVNAFIHLAAGEALAEAEAVDRRIAAGEAPGPLVGVPVAVKDLVHVAGMPTSFGSAVFAGGPSPGDAVPVARLRAAGAVIVGKTTTPEFGHKPVTESPLFGRTLNPWNPRFTSGGSSGGSGAAVATREVPLALGTDGGGSVRIPASACGVFGHKGTLGAVPHVHAPDLFGNNSYIGPMARTAGDLATAWRVMAGPDPADPWAKLPAPAGDGREIGALRVGWTLTVGNPAVELEVAAAFAAAVARLEVLGPAPREVAIDFYCHEPHFRVLLESALASRLEARIATDRARFDPSLVRTIELGLARSGVEVQRATAARTELYRSLEALFAEIDLLVTPTLAAAALPAGTDSHADVVIAGTDCGPIRAAWYPYTWPLNLTGHPAVTLPCGRTADGLPIGLQIAGRWHEDALVLAAAAALSEALAVAEHRWPR